MTLPMISFDNYFDQDNSFHILPERSDPSKKIMLPNAIAQNICGTAVLTKLLKR